MGHQGLMNHMPVQIKPQNDARSQVMENGGEMGRCLGSHRARLWEQSPAEQREERGPLRAEGLCRGETRGSPLDQETPGLAPCFQGSAVSQGTRRPAAARSCHRLQPRRLRCSRHRAGMRSPGRRHPGISHLLPELGRATAARGRETSPRPLLSPTSDPSSASGPAAPKASGRGRSHPGAPPQLREGAGWVLAWAQRRQDPLLSPAANAKSIRHVSAPQGNRLRPAEGSSQGRRRRLGGSAQGGRPGMCRAKAQNAADTLHPPPQPAPSCPALDPCPEGCGAPGAPVGKRQTAPLRGRAPPGLPALAAPLLALEHWKPRSQQTAHLRRRQSRCPAPGSLLCSGHPWGGERDRARSYPRSPLHARDAPPGAGATGELEGPQNGTGDDVLGMETGR